MPSGLCTVVTTFRFLSYFLYPRSLVYNMYVVMYSVANIQYAVRFNSHT